MAEQARGDGRGARYSALLLVLTGIALAGCVALAVGVTVRLVDLPRPRVTADLSRVSSPDSAGTDPSGDLNPVGGGAPSTAALVAEDAAKLAAQRAARQQASRSRVRRYTPPAVVAPSATPTPTPPSYPGGGQADPDHPGWPTFHPRDGHRIP